MNKVSRSALSKRRVSGSKFRGVSKHLWLGHTDDDWQRLLKKSHKKRPRLNSVEGHSGPLQALPKQKSSDAVGSCRKQGHLICVNSCSLLPVHLQVTFEENRPGSEAEVA